MYNEPSIWYKLKCIKLFKREYLPQFDGTEEIYKFIVWNLYDRVCEAIKSVIVLCENQSFFDAFLIAGHALETCSILSYIKDNPTEESRKLNYEKYSARCEAGVLIFILSLDSNLIKESSWNAYASALKIFYSYGETIIRKEKKETISSKEKHDSVIKILNNRLGLNVEKIKIIKENYIQPDPGGYIKSFSKRLNDIDDGLFNHFYGKYCAFKHGNLFSVGAVAENMNDDIVHLMLDIIYGITIYLDKCKLKEEL